MLLYRLVRPERRQTAVTSLTAGQLCDCSWFGGLSWLLLAGADLSSVLLPGTEEEEEPDPAGLLRLLFLPADNTKPKKRILITFNFD